jgi:hypothetical protein
LARRNLVLRHVAENFLGLSLGEEFIDSHSTNETGCNSNNASETIKLLVQAKESVETLTPIVFRLLIEPDAHWDELDRWSV